MKGRPRILLLYSHRPSGHARAAEALRRAFGDDPTAEVAELEMCRDLYPVLGPAVARAYLELAVKTPALWDALYDHRGVARATREFREVLHLLQGFKLRERILAFRPDLVVCTHALPCGSAAALKRRGELGCPLAAVPTDFSVHRYWLDPEVDLYLAPSASAARALAGEGVAPWRLATTGIPVEPGLESLPEAGGARRALGLDPTRPTAVLSGGSRGLGPLLQAAEILLARAGPAQFVVLCGHNGDLLREGRRRFGEDPRVRFLPFVEDIAAVLGAADVLVGKPGGLSMAETLAAGVPPLLFEPLAGQERRNTQFLLKAKAAWLAEGLDDLADRLTRLLQKGPEWVELKSRGRALGRADSARRARGALEELLGARVATISGSSSAGRAHGSGP